MWYLEKRIEISAAHFLELSYHSPCANLHGHNWIITVYCKSKELNEDGMIIDFSMIKDIIKDTLDHKNLNKVLDVNPTAENISKWIVDNIDVCYKATVQETEGNIITYVKEKEDVI